MKDKRKWEKEWNDDLFRHIEIICGITDTSIWLLCFVKLYVYYCNFAPFIPHMLRFPSDVTELFRQIYSSFFPGPKTLLKQSLMIRDENIMNGYACNIVLENIVISPIYLEASCPVILCLSKLILVFILGNFILLVLPRGLRPLAAITDHNLAQLFFSFLLIILNIYHKFTTS